jgi:hypothetical protein
VNSPPPPASQTAVPTLEPQPAVACSVAIRGVALRVEVCQPPPFSQDVPSRPGAPKASASEHPRAARARPEAPDPAADAVRFRWLHRRDPGLGALAAGRGYGALPGPPSRRFAASRPDLAVEQRPPGSQRGLQPFDQSTETETPSIHGACRNAGARAGDGGGCRVAAICP